MLVSGPTTDGSPDSTPVGPGTRKECVFPVNNQISDTTKMPAI